MRAGGQPGNYKDMPLASVLTYGEDLGIDVLQRTMDLSLLRAPSSGWT